MSQKNKKEKTAKAPKEKVYKDEPIRPYTVLDCMHLGLIGNLLFVAFIIICLIYYYSLAKDGNYFFLFEFVAYGVEITGFVMFSLAVIWLDRLVRARRPMKILLLIYIVVEVLLMLMEFQLLFPHWYTGLSLPMTIAHSLFSAVVMFSMLSLDPQNKNLEAFVIIGCTIILAGMFLGLAGYHVYASVLTNAFAYIFFFAAMKNRLRIEEMEIDCYGDQAKVKSFSSTMFADVPLMEEKDQNENVSIKKKVSSLRNQLSSEEQVILTDTEEKFEYEFGVEDDNEDDEDAEE